MPNKITAFSKTIKSNKNALVTSLLLASLSASTFASEQHNQSEITVTDQFIAAQRAMLAKNTEGMDFGPQSPRDIDNLSGKNDRIFGKAPHSSRMNLCNIHFHKNAEHKGGEFTRYAGNGNGKGYHTGYRYNGKLTDAELTPYTSKNSTHNDLHSGDTIELHYVYTTAKSIPGPTLASCYNDAIGNPQLRVEAQVFVLVNDESALDFKDLTAHGQRNGYHQALNVPNNTGRPIEYAGSTTGPTYNEEPSHFLVTWGVRPKVAKVNIATVEKWLDNNKFAENHAHPVRNLILNPELLSFGN